MEFKVEGKTTRQKKLMQLETLLNIEINISWTAILILWFLPWKLILAGIVAVLILGVLFILAISTLLFQLHKYIWASILILFVVIPLLVIHPFYHAAELYPAHYIFPLLIFAVYSLLLKMAIPAWPD